MHQVVAIVVVQLREYGSYCLFLREGGEFGQEVPYGK